MKRGFGFRAGTLFFEICRMKFLKLDGMRYIWSLKVISEQASE